MRVTCGWHTSTYDWHTDDIRVRTSTYEWHTDDIQADIDKIWAHTNDIQMTCEWNIKLYKGFGTFKLQFSKLFVVKTLF